MKNYRIVAGLSAKFSLLVICLFLFGTTNLISQIQISTVAQFESIGVPGSGFPLNGNYELMNDIGPVTQMVAGVFTGNFNGNGNRITVNINSPAAANVGLFSQISGGLVENLNIEGAVSGGQNSQNVGSLVGLISGTLRFITNFSNVTGFWGVSSVGGIA